MCAWVCADGDMCAGVVVVVVVEWGCVWNGVVFNCMGELGREEMVSL